MAAGSARVVCPRCGANNFDTVSACWKCNTPLPGKGVAPMQAAPAPMTAPQPAAYAPPRAEQPMMAGAVAPPVAYPVLAGDSGAAKRAALALALTLPWIGLPVGWIFMMIEDHRRQAIGRYCAFWSCIGLVLHLILFYFSTVALTAVLMRMMLSTMSGMSNQGRGMSENLDLNSGGMGGMRTPGGFGGMNGR